MSEYLEMAREKRASMTPEGMPAYNCAQVVTAVFADAVGLDEAHCMKAAACFGGGMQMGSVCGAVTGGLIVLGLAGVNDGRTVRAFYQKLRERHDGMLECRELLRAGMARGLDRVTHCNNMIFDSVAIVEELLRERGKL